LLSEAPVPRPARPSVMSRHLKSRTRQAQGSTAAALPQRAPISFAHSTHTQYPWMVVPSALRDNYDRRPGRIRFLICAATPMMPLSRDRVWLVPLRALRHPPATPPGEAEGHGVPRSLQRWVALQPAPASPYRLLADASVFPENPDDLFFRNAHRVLTNR
jgi:hypothetical protein